MSPWLLILDGVGWAVLGLLCLVVLVLVVMVLAALVITIRSRMKRAQSQVSNRHQGNCRTSGDERGPKVEPRSTYIFKS